MLKKVCSILSGLFFLLMILPLALPYSPGSFDLLDFILSIHFYLPIMLGVAGIVAGMMGVSGNVKISLVLLNILGLAFYVFVTLMAIFGFKEP